MQNDRVETFQRVTASMLVLSLLTMFQYQSAANAKDRELRSAAILSISVLPETVQLGGVNRQQQLLISARTQSGETIDVTDRCEISFADANVANINGAVVYGMQDGETTMHVRIGDVVCDVPIVVQNFDGFPAVDFQRDIEPLLSKLRCNSGGCHGKQSGQNGFKLSVFGFDPAADFDALVKEARGRRVFPAAPEQSLVVRKATATTPHGGGRRADDDSIDIEWIKQWIRQGAKWETGTVAALTSLEVAPAERRMKTRSAQQILVTAIYENGSRRDVTSEVLYSTNSPSVANVDERGRIETTDLPGRSCDNNQLSGASGRGTCDCSAGRCAARRG